jgi:hypothetical protein
VNWVVICWSHLWFGRANPRKKKSPCELVGDFDETLRKQEVLRLRSRLRQPGKPVDVSCGGYSKVCSFVFGFVCWNSERKLVLMLVSCWNH